MQILFEMYDIQKTLHWIFTYLYGLKEQPKCIHVSNVQCTYLISIMCQVFSEAVEEMQIETKILH